MSATRQTKAPAKRKNKAKGIDRTARIADLLHDVPDAAEIFALHGLHCAGCQWQDSDTLEDGALLHGMSEDNLEDLLNDLKTGLPESMRRPKTIIVTKDAAEALRDTLRAEGKEGWKLIVMTDEAGGFCMEFAEKTPEGHRTFTSTSVPEVEVVASDLTLASLGGSTIDMREGRFKLDLPSVNECECKKKISGI